MNPQDSITYYLIYGRIVGKGVGGDDFNLDAELGWLPDEAREIADHLMGYDPYEPADSPCKMFNMSITSEIWEVSEEVAMELMAGQ